MSQNKTNFSQSYVLQNPEYIESLYNEYKSGSDTVPETWQRFFEGFEFASKQASNQDLDESESSYLVNKEIKVTQLIEAYQARGHLLSATNPVRERRAHKADLALSGFGLSDEDLKTSFKAGEQIEIGTQSLEFILAHLKRTYCEQIGVEFKHIKNDEIRNWLGKNMHQSENKPNYSTEKRKAILKKLAKAVGFENFLHTKYVGKKRFSLEGCEALIPALNALIEEGVTLGAEEFVFGMAHRGRLNVLTNVFHKPPQEVFSEFEETMPKETGSWSGDVKYHLGRSSDINVNGKDVHLSLVPNPSHLETVNPVVTGIVYSKKNQRYQGDSKKIVPVLIHGDAAFAGQGVNYECTNFADLEGYSVGGTVHIVLNNQIGFTTDYLEARSSMYCTDIAKILDSPVFHVNADYPEAVTYCIELAIQLRQTFGIDVYVDILGYRRYGHNEGDEPRFTQPKLYKTIDKHPNVYELYKDRLMTEGTVTKAAADEILKSYKSDLQVQLDSARQENRYYEMTAFTGVWNGLRVSNPKDFTQSIDTSISTSHLNKVLKVLTTYPEGFKAFSKMDRLIKQRKSLIESKKLDWGLAEQLAFGALVLDGHGVRLSGQDCRRGTFSHRHAVIRDTETEDLLCFINQLGKEKELSVFNSHLSEYGVMGFEYGYSLSSPNDLVIWEAQFGDFSNGAQIVIDQYLSSAQTKWNRHSGLTLLLPHGYEGQGPEHSSARLERYLQLCAENNMYVTNPTTPANLFHMLVRQVKNPFRIPLVVMSPKSLLRHPLVQSDFSEFTKGCFKEVIPSEFKDEKKALSKKGTIKKVLVCSGKIYYDLLAARQTDEIAIVRLEQLYPLPFEQLAKLEKTYGISEWVWVQEEPKNMGAWPFICCHLDQLKWSCVAKPASSSPAVGNSKLHAKQQQDVIDAALKLK